MAKNFASRDAKQLIKEHLDLREKISRAISSSEQYRMQVKNAAESMVMQEVLEILRGVPVEEVNRDKRGIRTKALREYGYDTLADLAGASVHQIAAVRGISEDTAYTIKRIVREFLEQTQKELKIKISADNKTKSATQLVTAISVYKNAGPHIESCKRMDKAVGARIDAAIVDLAPAKNSLKWILTSKAKKKRAEDAYYYMESLSSGSYRTDVEATMANLTAATRTTPEDSWREFEKQSIQFFNIVEEIAPGVLGTDDSIYGLPEDLAREIQEECFFPDGLLCTLRRYQEWGVKYILHQERVLLGDEMGLGKTIQAIAAMVSLRNTGGTHFIVVCPASVITNWCREIAKQSKLSVTKIHGTGRKAALSSWLKTGGVAVTTYETTGHLLLEDDFKFSLLVVDEAHYIKNEEAQRTVHVKKISTHAERLLFMTGTALENKVEEMVALIKILKPDIASQIHSLTFMSAAPQFREKVAPVYYRRRREDVLTELPELIENKEWCTMSPAEEKVYEETVLAKKYADIRQVSWNVEDLKDSSKAQRLLELIEEAEEDNRKVIVFSFFLNTIRKIGMLLGSKALNPINGSVHLQRRQEIIDEFDKAPAGTVLLAQIQSGGTGLNIQSASVVIICEPQFKPSIENQAIARAYRMGQARNVLVYRLLCDETVDERIMEKLEEKQKIFDTFADTSVAAEESMELDEKSFGDIVKEEIERINEKRNS